MIVAISQRNLEYYENRNIDALETNYIKYFESFGFTLLPIPNVCKNVWAYFKKFPIDSIILSGGNDVSPSLYGIKQRNKDSSEQRDNTERKLIEIALEKRLPVFGTCRGMQFINVFFGGRLIQNVKSKTGVSHVRVIHPVQIVDKKAAEFLNKDEFIVNSYHNQGIYSSSLSPELKSFAISKEGVVEGIYHPNHPIAGIQWHPERPNSDKKADKKLVESFINHRLFWELNSRKH